MTSETSSPINTEGEGSLLRSDRLYMMPVHFGPHTGPRQRPDGGRFIDHPPQRKRRIAVRFETESAALAALLPPGFSLWSDPVVTIEMSELRDVAWLAGRGYNTLGVAVPAVHQSDRGDVHGMFLSVLWENLADPILTGREQLGFNKIFADISDIEERDGSCTTSASWLGFEFCRLNVHRGKLLDTGNGTAPPALPGKGLLHYKYIPRTGGAWEQADAAYATLSPWPAATPDQVGTMPGRFWAAEGVATFQRARWEDLPTQFRIVNALVDLPIIRWLPGQISETLSAADYRDQQIL